MANGKLQLIDRDLILKSLKLGRSELEKVREDLNKPAEEVICARAILNAMNSGDLTQFLDEKRDG